MNVLIDGKSVPKEQAAVSVFDHGLLYGDGVFEGIRAYNGRVFKLEEHVRRLYDSAQAICLSIPMSQADLCADVLRACRENGIRDGYVRLVVTRGVGTLGLNPRLCDKPQVIIIADTIRLYPHEVYERGLNMITVGTSRNLPEAINPRIKSLNYLNNVLGKIEALHAGAEEGLMLNSQGYVAEATGENVFVVRDGQLRTPPAWCGALEGITRNCVMDLAREAGYTVREDVLQRYDLYTADEVFLTGTAAELIAVVRYDDRAIGAGTPGPVTRDLGERFSTYASSVGTPIE
jgi:branched-chain amino acid aminotransferase